MLLPGSPAGGGFPGTGPGIQVEPHQDRVLRCAPLHCKLETVLCHSCGVPACLVREGSTLGLIIKIPPPPTPPPPPCLLRAEEIGCIIEREGMAPVLHARSKPMPAVSSCAVCKFVSSSWLARAHSLLQVHIALLAFASHVLCLRLPCA